MVECGFGMSRVSNIPRWEFGESPFLYGEEPVREYVQKCQKCFDDRICKLLIDYTINNY